MAKKDSDPAFPTPDTALANGKMGMSFRQYAAITLRVPNSGTDWLDAMILESLRNELAAKVMQGLVLTWKEQDCVAASEVPQMTIAAQLFRKAAEEAGEDGVEFLTSSAYEIAASMLAARKEAADANRDWEVE